MPRGGRPRRLLRPLVQHPGGLDQAEQLATQPGETRPFVMIEYTHAMGNSNGNVPEYWELVHRYPRLIGGFAWDWMDQGLLQTSEDGSDYWAYGGDFGPPGTPSDANFCVNGLLWPDQTPKPALHEIAKTSTSRWRPRTWPRDGCA